jgi:CheY-like chemotaxis protein
MARLIYIDEVYYTEAFKSKFNNGIEYVRYLRRIEKNITPIVFTSFHSANEVLEKPNTQIITAIGHGFIQLPYTQKEYEDVVNDIEALNEIQLQDVIINFCQLRSSVREGFHVFKGRLREIKGMDISKNDRNKFFFAEFENYEKELIKDVGNYPEILSEYKNIIAKYNADDEKTIEIIEAVQEEQFVCYLPADDNLAIEKSSEKKGWKVLFLDDKPSELESVLHVLTDKGIGYEIATSSDQAKDAIEADKQSNKICVVVSDYRLFEADAKGVSKPRMQKEQGYDFLLWLSKQDRYNAMVALSGLSKWFLMDSFRRNRINVKVYSKSGLLGGGAKLFVDDIEYLGNQYNEVVNSQPKASLWREIQYVDKEKTKVKSYSLKPYYVYHRNSNEYLTNENNINQQAEKVARELEFALDHSSNFNFASMVSIQGNATKTMKGEIELEYADFQLKLLQRRVFFYLILKGFDRDAISKMLHKGDSQSEMSESMIKQIPSMLAIQTETDIPYGLLVEEKYFFHHFMQLPIYNIAELMDQTYSIINAVLTKHLKSDKSVVEKLKNYITGDDSNMSFGTVSMTEVHVVLDKVVDLLIRENKNNEAHCLIFEIGSLISDLKDLVPDKNKLKLTIRKIDALNEKIEKRI